MPVSGNTLEYMTRACATILQRKYPTLKFDLQIRDNYGSFSYHLRLIDLEKMKVYSQEIPMHTAMSYGGDNEIMHVLMNAAEALGHTAMADTGHQNPDLLKKYLEQIS